MASEKYLAIRNWAKYQARTDKHGRSMDGRCRPYIRDYTEKEMDSDYVALTCVQRYVLDGCQRLRGRLGRNLNNDPMWIMRQLCVDHVERKYGTRAVNKLVMSGFLIPTNQQFDYEQKPKNILDVDVEVDLEVDVKGANTKASTSLTHPHPDTNSTSSNSKAGARSTAELNPVLEGKTKLGRPVLTAAEIDMLRGLASKLKYPRLVARDYAIAAQFRDQRGGWNSDVFHGVIDARGGTESFKNLGDALAAAIGYGQYIAERNRPGNASRENISAVTP